MEHLISPASGLKFNLGPFQSEVQKLNEQPFAGSKKFEKSTIAAAIVEQVIFHLRIMSQASQNNSKGAPTELQNAKTAVACHVAMVKVKTALTDNANLKQQEKLSSLRAECESHQRGLKKKLVDVTTSYN